MSRRAIDLTGLTFGRLTVVERAIAAPIASGEAFWICTCACGAIRRVAGSKLRGGLTVSCGCYSRDASTKHGAAGKLNAGTRTRIVGRDPVYAVWAAMIQRCSNPKDKGYKNYGGRGIKVCDKWRDDFEAFRDDMGYRPQGLTVERRNNNGDYMPENCYWASRVVQNNNTRRNATNWTTP